MKANACALLASLASARASPHPPPSLTPPSPSHPPQDVFESAEAFKITLDLPGVDASALKVSFTEGILTVTAEPSRGAERGGGAEGRWLRRERAATSLRRAFRVPAGVDAEAIEASLEDGVLVLVLPKVGAAVPAGGFGGVGGRGSTDSCMHAQLPLARSLTIKQTSPAFLTPPSHTPERRGRQAQGHPRRGGGRSLRRRQARRGARARRRRGGRGGPRRRGARGGGPR